MLKIIEGGLYSKASDVLADAVRGEALSGRRVYLLVPEQKTLQSEKEMIGVLKGISQLSFEVTNFTRLANTVFREKGGIAKEYSDGAKRSLIMWKALTELSGELSTLDGEREISAGSVEKALRAVSEMQSLSITPNILTSLLDEEKVKSDKRLSSKILDLSKIIIRYKDLLSEKYCDTGDDIDVLCDLLKEDASPVRDAVFFIDGFMSFTEPQYTLLKILIRNSSVTVHLSIPKEDPEAYEYTELLRTRDRLVRLSGSDSGGEAVTRVGELRSERDILLREIANLFHKSGGILPRDLLDESISERIRLLRCVSAYEECDFVASDIRRRVIEGAKYSDFAVIARDTEGYLGIIDTQLKAAKIPYFISKTKKLSTVEAVKFIYSAFEIIKNNFSRRDLISYMKCGYSGIDRDACDEFEIYAETWQISGKRFFTEGDFIMNPDGLSAKRTEKSDEALLRINETKKTVLTPLLKLCAKLETCLLVRDFATVLLEFLTDINLEEEIEKKRHALTLIGEKEAALENEGIYSSVIDALDTLVFALGDTPIDLSGFLSQLKVVMSSYTFGRLPAHVDEVTVGSADTLRLSKKKYVYLIGVNRGEFPKSYKSNSYFTERDKAALSLLGVNIEPDSDRLFSNELFFFTRAFSIATECVTIISSDRNAAFDPSHPSEIFDRITEITGGVIAQKYISEIPLYEKIYYPSFAISSLAKAKGEEKAAISEALLAFGYKDSVEMQRKSITNESLSISGDVKGLIYKDELRSSQSRIDSYVSCPFAYFLRYNLGLSENEKAEFNARNIGTFIHALLEDVLRELKTRGIKPKDLSDEDKREIVRRSAEEYVDKIYRNKSFKSKRTEIQIERLCRSTLPLVEGLCDEFSVGEYEPEYFELQIGGKDKSSPDAAKFVSEDGKKVLLSGFIDRVDTFRDGEDIYVRVVDYKTGSKNFSPKDLDEGKNLQMFLYLEAIVESESKAFRERLGIPDTGKIIPAGVIYNLTDINDVYINTSDEGEEALAVKEKQDRQGMLLYDEKSISKMNPEYIPIKYLSDGVTPNAASRKLLYTEEEWGDLTKKIKSKVIEISDKMRSGDISLTKEEKNPPCDYCKYRPVCRKKFN